MDQLRQHPFFNGIDWDAVGEKKMNPPVVLGKVPAKDKVPVDKSSGNEMDDMFQNGCVASVSWSEKVLIDKDYEEHNKTYNRVKNYSFERQQI